MGRPYIPLVNQSEILFNNQVCRRTIILLDH